MRLSRKISGSLQRILGQRRSAYNRASDRSTNQGEKKIFLLDISNFSTVKYKKEMKSEDRMISGDLNRKFSRHWNVSILQFCSRVILKLSRICMWRIKMCVYVASEQELSLSGPVKPKVTVPCILLQCLTRSSVTRTVPSHSAILGMTG